MMIGDVIILPFSFHARLPEGHEFSISRVVSPDRGGAMGPISTKEGVFLFFVLEFVWP